MNEVIVEVVDKQKENYEIEDALTVVVRDATSLQVVDDASYLKAGELLQSIKGSLKQVDAYWETPKKQAYASYKTILGKLKEMKSPLESAEKVLKAGIGAYMMIKEDERKKLEAEAKEQYGVDLVLDTNTPKIDGVSTTTAFEVDVVDISQVPVIFNGVQICIVDVAQVKQLAKMMKGNLTIPGIKISETKIVRSSCK